MADVFISYSSKDAASANYLLKTLESMYLTCWMAPRDIPAGDNFADVIPAAMRSSKVFLVLVSRNSQNSPQVLNELTFASTIKIPRFSVQLDDLPLTNSFQYHIPAANRFNGAGRLAAASSEIVSRLHQEIRKGQPEPLESPEEAHQRNEAHLRKVAPQTWCLLVAGAAVILIVIGCLALMLKLFDLADFRRYLTYVIILGIVMAMLVRTSLFQEESAFYQAFLKLLRLINRLPFP